MSFCDFISDQTFVFNIVLYSTVICKRVYSEIMMMMMMMMMMIMMTVIKVIYMGSANKPYNYGFL